MDAPTRLLAQDEQIEIATMRGCQVAEVMRRELVTCLPTTRFDELAGRMARHAAHALVVVDQAGYALGLVSQTDLLHARQGRAPAELAALTAAALMTPTLVTCTPDMSLAEAIEALMRAGVHRLVVVKPGGGKLYPLGIIALTDIIWRLIGETRASAEER